MKMNYLQIHLKKTLPSNSFLLIAVPSWDEIVSENDLKGMMETYDWVKYILEKPLDAVPGTRIISIQELA